MRPVSNAFLLNMAEVSATLIGLFLVGVFFYVEAGFRRLDRACRVRAVHPGRHEDHADRVRDPLGLSLSLVAFEPV